MQYIRLNQSQQRRAAGSGGHGNRLEGAGQPKHNKLL